MAGKGPAPSGFTISMGIEDVVLCETSTGDVPAQPDKAARATTMRQRTLDTSYPLSIASCLNMTSAST